MTAVEREPALTRAEELHVQRFNNGQWSTESLSPMFAVEPSRETLLRLIARAEEELPAREDASAKASAKADRANAEARNRGSELRRARDDLDIYKIMLAEQMEIPR